MKKNKKKFEKLIGNVNTTSKKPGSVAEFIELLQNFPEDGKVTLDGCMNIDGLDEEGRGVTIYPKSVLNDVEEFDSADIEYSASDDILLKHTYGVGYNNSELSDALRTTSTDSLICVEVMSPNEGELKFENHLLSPHQACTIDEIRHHNAYVAECLGELHRREIAALLEYNTQCLAHFGIETNKTMCDIVDAYKDENIVNITNF